MNLFIGNFDSLLLRFFRIIFLKGVNCDVTDMQLISFSLASLPLLLLPFDRYQFQLIWKALNSYDWSIFFRSKNVFWIFFLQCLKSEGVISFAFNFTISFAINLLNVHCNIWKKSYQSYILRGVWWIFTSISMVWRNCGALNCSIRNNF